MDYQLIIMIRWKELRNVKVEEGIRSQRAVIVKYHHNILKECSGEEHPDQPIGDEELQIK